MYGRFSAIILCTFLSSCSFNNNNNLTNIRFDHLSIDSLYLNVQDTLECSFILWNIGRKDLIINNVIPSCDCQVVNYNSNPIEKGKSSEITIKFSSNYAKSFHENVFVYYNGSDSPKMLSISGRVVDRQNAVQNL